MHCHREHTLERTPDISLTQEGRRQTRDALEQHRQRHQEMFSALSGEEKAQLLALLKKINSDWEVRYQDAKGRHNRYSRHGGGHDCEHSCRRSSRGKVE